MQCRGEDGREKERLDFLMSSEKAGVSLLFFLFFTPGEIVFYKHYKYIYIIYSFLSNLKIHPPLHVV